MNYDDDDHALNLGDPYPSLQDHCDANCFLDVISSLDLILRKWPALIAYNTYRKARRCKCCL